MAWRIVVGVVVVALFGAAGYWLLHSYLEPPPAPAPPVLEAVPEKKGPDFPIGSEAKSLPKLNESDPTLLEAATGLIDPKSLAKFFNLEDGIRKIVATVDNLSREHLARFVNVTQSLGGQFLVSGKDDTLAIGPKNAARYNAFVTVVEAVDTKKAVATYVSLYPLFQQAFVELGYPDGYFNDRLVEVIDHLIEAPEPKGPIKLTAPKVLYEFADPDLEVLSSGQKIMIRVGPENEAKLKAKLKEIRAEVVAASKPGSDPISR